MPYPVAEFHSNSEFESHGGRMPAKSDSPPTPLGSGRHCPQISHVANSKHHLVAAALKALATGRNGLNVPGFPPAPMQR